MYVYTHVFWTRIGKKSLSEGENTWVIRKGPRNEVAISVAGA